MSSLLLLGAEFGLILVLIFIVGIVYFLRRRKADKRYVYDFIAEHKSTQIERREEAKALMKTSSLLSDENIEVFLDSIHASENRLYKKILNMYLGFDRNCLPDIRDDLSEMNNNWIETVKNNIKDAVEIHMNEMGSVSNENVEELNNKIDVLTTDNKKIASELAEAMETMEDIVKEYSLMYAGQENPTMDRLSDDYDKLKKKSDSHKEEGESID